MIVAEWKNVATALEKAAPTEYQTLLNLDAVYRIYMVEEVSEHREAIAGMLNELATSIECYYEDEDWMCILGM